MAIPDPERLLVAELIFYTPLLPLSLFVLIRHGASRRTGWIYISILALLRIIAAATGIAAYTMTPTTPADRSTQTNLFTAMYICQSIGATFLVSCLLGLLSRVNAALTPPARLSPQLQRLVAIPLLVAIITSAASSSDPVLAKVSAILLLLLVPVFALACAYLFRHMGALAHARSERIVLFAVALLLPVLLVRLIYGVCLAFIASGVFDRLHPEVWVEAFMAVAEEFVIAGVVCAVGLMTPQAEGQVAEELQQAKPHRQRFQRV